MPRQSKPTGNAGIKNTTLVIDNGAHTIKAGFATAAPNAQDCRIIPNCIARDREKKVWIGSQLEQCKDFGEMAFRRPVEKGYIVNWESEKAIWGHSFFSQNPEIQCDPHETNLILTESPNCPQALQTNCDQMVFEEFEFATYCRYLGPALNAYNDIPALFGEAARDQDTMHRPVECLLLVDSGYSHTTVTPLVNGRPVQQAIRRLDIGGKFLTNYLKEQLSQRTFVDFVDETYVVNEIKETTCFVSHNFRGDLERTWKGGKDDRREVDTSIVVDYLLPDYETVHHGVIRPHDPMAAQSARPLSGPLSREKVVTVGNERFIVPELLFNPGDVAMKESGLPTVIMESVGAMPSGLRPAMLANVVVVGGNVRIPGLVDRVRDELRQLAPSYCNVRVASPEDPVRATWLGGARMATHRETLSKLLVTRSEYLEHGPNWVLRKFATAGR